MSWIVSIPKAESVMDPLSGKPYELFHIQVSDGNNSWTVLERYSKIYELHCRLDDRLPGAALPPFPGKSFSIFGGHSKEFIESRRAGLETYLLGIAQHYLHVPDVRRFLDPNNMSRALSQGPMMMAPSPMMMPVGMMMAPQMMAPQMMPANAMMWPGHMMQQPPMVQGPVMAPMSGMMILPTPAPLPAQTQPPPSAEQQLPTTVMNTSEPTFNRPPTPSRNPLNRSDNAVMTTPAQGYKFLVPPPPATHILPQSIRLPAGDSILIYFLISDIRDCMGVLAAARDAVDASRDLATKFDVVERWRSKLQHASSSIKSSRVTIIDVINNLPQSHVPDDGRRYLFAAAHDMLAALQWYENLDQSLMADLDSTTPERPPSPPPATTSIKTSSSAVPVSFAPPTPNTARRMESEMDQRVRTYEEDAENMVVASLQGGSAVQNDLKQLRESIQRDLQLCGATPDLNRFMDRLKKTLAYLDMVINNSNSNRADALPEDQITRYEEQLYDLLFNTTEVDGKPIENATVMREKILNMMKEVQEFRANMMKKNLHLTKPHLLNRLEDLQENLGNFEHYFSSTNQFEKNWAERARELYKSKALKEARKVHTAVETEMFEL